MNSDGASSLYGEVAFRMLGASVIVALLLLIGPSDVSFVLLGALVMLTIDLRDRVSLKNFFLVSVFLIFGVGADVLKFTEVKVATDAIFYVCAFLIGYAISSVPRTHVAASAESDNVDHRRGAIRNSRPELRQASIVRAMAALTGLNALLLLFQFTKYGIVGYYRGQQLLDQFLTYGKANPAGGAEQIVRFGLTYSAIALVVLYSQASIEASRPIRYRYPVGLLVVIPILLLHRYDAVVGAATAVGIYSCERRVSTAGGARARPSPPAPGRSRNRVRGAAVTVGIVVAFGGALIVGSVRHLSPNSQAPSVGTVALVTEEFATVQAYADIKTNLAILGHPHGRTIVLPLIFKIIPRAWLPNKPLNSGAYYMSIVHPESFAAGFEVPPTIFGDALLSFGFVGALAVFLVLGFVTARVDIGYKEARRSRIPFFLIVFANYYPLMISPISESMAGILLTLLVWGTANHLFRLGASPSFDSADSGDRPSRRPAVTG